MAVSSSRVREIENAIAALSSDDLQELYVWLEQKSALLKENPRHPSVQFKKILVKDGVELWSARVTQDYRALAVRRVNLAAFLASDAAFCQHSFGDPYESSPPLVVFDFGGM